MRAAVIHEHGGRDKIVVEDVPRPVAGPGEILVEVKACGLNHLDIFVRRGMPGVSIDLPRITGGDIAGVIEAVGDGVAGLSSGQRVLLDPMIVTPNGQSGALGEHTTGGLAEYIAVPATNAIPLPVEVSFVQAAALPIAYGAAWRMMVTRGGGGPPAGARPPQLAEPQVDFPEEKPPFVEQSAMTTPDGQLWVRRSASVGTPATYDVFDATGRHVRQVVLPKSASVVGFGNGTVYVARTDEDDLVYLGRYRRP